jgi:hypothetical protein
MADRIAEMIPRWKKCFDLHTLVINADNGPESNGHRTQWLSNRSDPPPKKQPNTRQT